MTKMRIACALSVTLFMASPCVAQVTGPAQSNSTTMPATAEPEVKPTGQSTGPTAASDRAAIAHAEQVVAVSTNLDEVMSYFDQNATLENLTPGETHGAAAIRADLGKFFGAYPDFEVHLKKIDITSDGRLGYACTIQHVTAKGRNGLADIDITFRVTDLYKKQNGKWLIVYQHTSVPVDLKTGKADYGR